ncbi:MAG TPA: phosphatidylinositol-specific phospholipase C/glycerophosphodiester phosphodiesterase family protein [Planctomycetaceae bacterium]
MPATRPPLVRRLPPGVLLLVAGAAALAADPPAAPKPLPRAHAHNDYRHERPLLDALDRGFGSVEADVFLVDGELLVGHDREELRPGRTLEALYLAPLRERVQANGGRVSPDGPPLFLLVDVKDDAETTYAALHRLLAEYDDILSAVRDGEFEPKAVTVVLSGNRAQETVRKQPTRYVGIDGRPSDLDRDEPAHVLPWISANWNDLFRWKGDGPMPEAERTKLRDYVAKAHDRGRLVRFWATPESEAVWTELLAAGVDLIGTDDLDRLKRFLSERP